MADSVDIHYSQALTLLTTALSQLAISFALFTAFCLLRNSNKAIYQPRLKYLQPNKNPPELSNSLLGWIAVYSISDYSESHKIGLDAVMFLIIAKFFVRFFLFSLIFCVPLMLIHVFS